MPDDEHFIEIEDTPGNVLLCQVEYSAYCVVAQGNHDFEGIFQKRVSYCLLN